MQIFQIISIFVLAGLLIYWLYKRKTRKTIKLKRRRKDWE